jgi:hypothetical protein
MRRSLSPPTAARITIRRDFEVAVDELDGCAILDPIFGSTFSAWFTASPTAAPASLTQKSDEVKSWKRSFPANHKQIAA